MSHAAELEHDSETKPAPAINTTRPAHMTADIVVAKVIALRDKVAEVQERHHQELAPYHLVQATLEAWLLDDLNKARVKSMRAPAGTFYTSTRASTKVVDWSATLDFIRSREAWDLLEHRVSKTAANAIMEETKEPIPGVETTQEVVLNVRRATKPGA